MEWSRWVNEVAGKEQELNSKNKQALRRRRRTRNWRGKLIAHWSLSFALWLVLVDKSRPAVVTRVYVDITLMVLLLEKENKNSINWRTRHPHGMERREIVSGNNLKGLIYHRSHEEWQREHISQRRNSQAARQITRSFSRNNLWTAFRLDTVNYLLHPLYLSVTYIIQKWRNNYNM